MRYVPEFEGKRLDHPKDEFSQCTSDIPKPPLVFHTSRPRGVDDRTRGGERRKTYLAGDDNVLDTAW